MVIGDALAVFLMAAAYDILLGEPPAKIHPVVWIGKLIALLRSRLPPTKLGGVVLALMVIAATVLAGHLLVRAAGFLPILPLLVSAFLLKSTFASALSASGIQRHRQDDRGGHGSGQVNASRPGGPGYGFALQGPGQLGCDRVAIRKLCGRHSLAHILLCSLRPPGPGAGGGSGLQGGKHHGLHGRLQDQRAQGDSDLPEPGPTTSSTSSPPASPYSS